MKRKGCGARGEREEEREGAGRKEDNASKDRTRRSYTRKLLTRNSQLVGFCKTGRRAETVPSENPSFSFVVVVVVVGRLRENSAPLQLTITIKILPWAPPTSCGH